MSRIALRAVCGPPCEQKPDFLLQHSSGEKLQRVRYQGNPTLCRVRPFLSKPVLRCKSDDQQCLALNMLR